MKHNLTIIIVFIFLSFGCKQCNSDISSSPSLLTASIPTATLKEVGMNEVIIKEIVDSIKSGFYPNRHSLLIFKDGKLVLKEYFTGQDENWGVDIGNISHNDSTLHDTRSISKSVVSACIGIAIKEGYINEVDQPIFDFFSDYKEFATEKKSQLTIRHLLTMTDGMDW